MTSKKWLEQQMECLKVRYFVDIYNKEEEAMQMMDFREMRVLFIDKCGLNLKKWEEVRKRYRHSRENNLVKWCQYGSSSE